MVNPEHSDSLAFGCLIAVVFCGFYLLPLMLAYGVGTLAVFASGFYSIRRLINLVSWDQITRPVRRWLAAFAF